MRGGWQVVLKVVRYSARSVLGGSQRYAKKSGMCMRKRLSERGRLGSGRSVQSAQGKHKKQGNE